MNARVPVVVVSGFLGSGKTTLVRRMLADAQAHGIRLGVVSNEFGALGIDAALLGRGGAELVELAGGCVCCELSDSLVETLQAMRAGYDPDRIVIETSGVALPFDTQLNLYRPGVREWVGDEACLVVVDAEHVDDGGDTLAQQVASADLVLLNKTDLVPAERVLARVQAMNPAAPVLPCVQGDVPMELLYPSGPARPKFVAPHHHEGFAARELRAPDGLDEDGVSAWLDAHRALRMKGFVATTAGVRVVQGVGARVELTEPAEPVDPALIGRVVVIERT